MSNAKKLGILLAVLVSVGAVAYLGRGLIRDALFEAGKPDLPEAVSYEETKKGTGDTGQGTEVEEVVVEEKPVEVVPVPTPVEPTPEPVIEPSEPATPPVTDASIPSEFNLAVPFTSQAPFSNWDHVHGEACEEASLLMVNAYYEGEPAGKIDPSAADKELLHIVDFENSLFGYFEDTTAEQTGLIASQLYGYARVEVFENPTVEDIKRHVAAGRPVIVPAAGRELGNPYFTAPGPIYHMIVIRGYTKTSFITNDPGTRHGESYVYKIETIMSAMHDWNGGDVANGAKKILVVYPET